MLPAAGVLPGPDPQRTLDERRVGGGQEGRGGEGLGTRQTVLLCPPRGVVPLPWQGPRFVSP